MTQTGTVEKTNGKFAEIKIIRSSACGDNCASCGLCSGAAGLVNAKNTAGASIGDSVIIEMPDSKVLGAAFLVYIVPLVMLFAGYFAAYALFKSDTAGIISGLLLLAATFFMITLYDRRKKNIYVPQVVGIISPNS